MYGLPDEVLKSCKSALRLLPGLSAAEFPGVTALNEAAGAIPAGPAK